MYAADKIGPHCGDASADCATERRIKSSPVTRRSRPLPWRLNPLAMADVLGGGAVDVTMVVTLAHIYGLEMSTMHAKGLVIVDPESRRLGAFG